MCGLLSVGFLAEPVRLLKAYDTDQHPGFFYSLATGSPNATLLACQVIGILFVIGWTMFTMVPFFIWLNFMGWFRSGSIQELVGLDITYNLAEDMGVGEDGVPRPGGEDEDEAKYMDAYERYRQQMRGNRERARQAGSDQDIDSEDS